MNKYLKRYQDIDFDALLDMADRPRDMFPSFEPSDYQLDFYKAVFFQCREIIPRHNIQLRAVAGSGKSTTARNAMKLLDPEYLRNKVLVTAFSAKIVKTFKEELEREGMATNCMGVNSAGWRTLRNNLQQHLIHNEGKTYSQAQAICKASQKVDSRKYSKLLSLYLEANPLSMEVITDEDFDMSKYTKNIRRLVDLSRQYMTTTAQGIQEVAKKYHITPYLDELEVARTIMLKGISDYRSFDFIDQYFIPLLNHYKEMKFAYRWVFPKFDMIFIDEAQDLNKAQRNFLYALKTKEGTIFSIGDVRQCIFRFAGADVESFDALGNLPNTQLMDLTMSYRVRNPHVVSLIRKIVPYFEVPEWVETADKDQHPQPEHTVWTDVQAGDYVVCRNTAPLIESCLQFVSRGIKANVMGIDIGESIKRVIDKTSKKIKSQDALKVVAELKCELDARLQTLMDEGLTAEDAQADSNVVNMEAMVDNALALIEGGCKTVEEMGKRLDVLFSDKIEGIVFCTAHRVKGLEADNVFILDPQRFPSKAARTAEDLAQEDNLLYVAYSRAKKVLKYLYASDLRQDIT
ncbi:MAG: UvrD-helicase domain-containing protein [Bacteroidota bacterium]